MTSSIDSLTGMPMPALAAPNATAQPNVAAAAATAGSGSGGFERLMRLQQRGRELEAKLTKDAAGASPSDPAATAIADQQQLSAKRFKELRELVGPSPGGNARRALAAVIERMEAGGELKTTDRARIRLAIAADERQVDLAGAMRMRAAIVSLDEAMTKTSELTKDPTLVQDAARHTQFQAQIRRRNEELQALETLIASGKFDQASIDGAFEPTR